MCLLSWLTLSGVSSAAQYIRDFFGRTFNIVEKWTGGISPSRGPAIGGSSVTLFGAGFQPNHEYAVVLTSTLYESVEEIMYVHGEVANLSTHIQWTTPTWANHFAGLSNLTTIGQPWISVQLSRLSLTTEIFNRRFSMEADGNTTLSGATPSNNTISLMKDEADFFSLVQTEVPEEGEPWQEHLFGFDMCWENVSTSEATVFASLKNETLHVYAHSFNL